MKIQCFPYFLFFNNMCRQNPQGQEKENFIMSKTNCLFVFSMLCCPHSSSCNSTHKYDLAAYCISLHNTAKTHPLFLVPFLKFCFMLQSSPTLISAASLTGVFFFHTSVISMLYKFLAVKTIHPLSLRSYIHHLSSDPLTGFRFLSTSSTNSSPLH